MDIVLCMREQGTMEKTPSMDVSEYCGRIQDLCDKLSSVGIKIEDHVMACFLLAGLVVDPDYSTYLRTTRIDKDLSAKVVTKKVVNAKTKREIKRRGIKGRRRDRRTTGEIEHRKKGRGPRDLYRLWLCLRSVT